MILLWLLLFQDAAALSAQGAAAMRAERFGEAIEAYRALVKLEPQNARWRMNLGLALYSSQRYAEATPQFESYLSIHAQPSAIHLLLGLSYLKVKQPCKAIAPLEHARTWDATRSLVELADAYYGCGRFERAARAYAAALATPKRSPQLQRQAAHCFWQARLYHEAEPHFRALENRFGDDADFQYEFGDTLTRIAGPAAGLPYLERAVTLQPTHLPARGEFGKALIAVGRHGDAIAHLQAGAQADPALLLPLARALRQIGQTAEAERVLADYRRRMTSAQP